MWRRGQVKTVKPIAEAKGWLRKKSVEVLGSGRGFVLVRV